MPPKEGPVIWSKASEPESAHSGWPKVCPKESWLGKLEQVGSQSAIERGGDACPVEHISSLWQMPWGVTPHQLIGKKGEPPPKSPLARIVGEVREGLVIENPPEDLDLSLISVDGTKQVDFVLRVVGKSMAPALDDGELVGVKFTTEARPGDIVIAEHKGQKVLARLRERNGFIWLSPDDPNYPPCFSPFKIIGVIKWVLKGVR